MAIDGAWAFVYSGAIGVGIGAFIIEKDGELHGRDYGGVTYTGTAKENKDGTITLNVKMSVPARTTMVQGGMPMDMDYDRLFSQSFPADFNNGKPIEIAQLDVTLMIRRMPLSHVALQLLKVQ